MTVLNVSLLIISILLETTVTVLSGKFSKTSLESHADNYKFNVVSHSASFLALLFFGRWGASLYTVLMAALFAAVITGSQFYKLEAFAKGPVSLTTFIQASSLVIPTIFGALLWQEPISMLQLILIAALIWMLALALNARSGVCQEKWLLFTILSALLCGGIGVLQTVQQLSHHKDEMFAFLRLSFLFAALMNLMLWRFTGWHSKTSFSLRSRVILEPMISGLFMGCVHAINLFLSGIMPKVFFFPVVNGGVIFASLLAAMRIFHERLTKVQWIGIGFGAVILCLIGVV